MTRKVGWICLALVTAVAMLGTSYAKWSQNLSVSTAAVQTAPPPALGPASSDVNTSGNTALLNCTLTSLGTASNVAVSFVYGTNPNNLSSQSSITYMYGTGVFNANIPVSANQTYYYMAKAQGLFTVYSDIGSFVYTGSGGVTINASLAAGRYGVPYAGSFSASGGTPGYTWSKTSGSLPDGLSLVGNTISGTPTAPGTFTFTIMVTDSASHNASASFSITITGSIAPPTSVLDHIIVSPANPSVASGGSVTYAAQGYDQFDSPMAATFVWSCANVTAGSIDSTTGKLTAGSTAGVYNNVIRATSGRFVGYASATITAGSGATQVRVETSPFGTGTLVSAQNLASGNSITLYAVSRDGSGNFVDNLAATWSLTGITGRVVGGDLVPASDGKSATFTAHATGTASIHAVSGALASVDSGTITVVGGIDHTIRVETAADGSGTLVAAPALTAGTSVTGFAISRDLNGNFLGNVAGAWSLANVTGGVANSDLIPSGDLKSATFTGHLVGSAVMRVVVDNLISTDSGTITVGAATPSASLSTVVANPTSVVADGATTSTITVTLLDAYSNLVSGKTVTLGQGSGHSIISAASGSSSSSGVVTFTVKDSTIESVTYSATDTTDSNLAITQTPSVSFTAVPAYTATAGAATNTPVAGASDTITLTVKNSGGSTDTTFTGAHNVTISGVSAAPNGSYGTFNGTTLTSASTTGQTISVTFSGGMASPALVLNDAAAQTIGFSISGVNTPATNNLSITPTAASVDHYSVSNVSSPQVTNTPFSVTIQAQDQYNNNITNGSQAAETVNITSHLTDSGKSPTSVLTSGGTATISNMTTTVAQSGQYLTFTGATSGKSGNSNTFTVRVPDTFTILSNKNWSNAGVTGTNLSPWPPLMGDTVNLSASGVTLTVDMASATTGTIFLGTGNNQHTTLKFNDNTTKLIVGAIDHTGNHPDYSTIDMTNGGTLVLTAASPITSGASGVVLSNNNGSSGTVNYGGSAQSVYSNNTYNNLTLSGSGAKTTTGATVNGILSMEGTATATGTVPTYGGSATLQYKGSGTQTTGSEFPATFSGSGGVIIANTSGSSVTLGGAKVISGSLTTNNGATLDASSNNYALTIGGDFANNGTFNARSGTVTFNASGAQAVGVATYYNLILQGSGSKTISAGTSVGSGGRLTIAPSGSTAKAKISNGANITVYQLTLGSTAQSPSTYGSTASSATNRNDTYFDNTATGILTVSH